MIQLIRIDDRLLHGQVAYGWKATLGFAAIVIANDEASKSEIRKKAIKMAAPVGVKVAIKNIEESVSILSHPLMTDVKVLVIVANPRDAKAVLDLIEERPTINLGGMMNGSGRREFAKAVYVNNEDVKIMDEILAEGFNIKTQQLPSEPVQSYASLREKFKGE